MPGHHDASNEYTSLDDAKKATRDAMDMGLAGIKNRKVDVFFHEYELKNRC